MPQIAVFNESTVQSDTFRGESDVQKMLPAFEQQWNQDLRPVWGVEQASFTLLPQGQTPDAGSWWLVFLDDSDQARALAYHDLTNDGMPISKVFVRTILNHRESLSVAATHELCEMAVDPWLNSAYQDPRSGTFWAGEVCDPVEADRYAYPIGDILVTDFITPNWFAHQRAGSAMDFKLHAARAFEVLAGGYAQYFDPRFGWRQVTGSMAMLSGGAEPAHGARRERRTRLAQSRSLALSGDAGLMPWERSAASFKP